MLERFTASPEDQFATDLFMKTDIPLFATSKAKSEFIGKHNVRGTRETKMMNVRGKVFEFHNRIPQHEQKVIILCHRCFAELIFLGNSNRSYQ